jgi:hypothetical protein
MSECIVYGLRYEHYKNFVHLQREPKPTEEVTQLIDEYFINEYDFKFIDNII